MICSQTFNRVPGVGRCFLLFFHTADPSEVHDPVGRKLGVGCTMTRSSVWSMFRSKKGASLPDFTPGPPVFGPFFATCSCLPAYSVRDFFLQSHDLVPQTRGSSSVTLKSQANVLYRRITAKGPMLDIYIYTVYDRVLTFFYLLSSSLPRLHRRPARPALISFDRLGVLSSSSSCRDGGGVDSR